MSKRVMMYEGRGGSRGKRKAVKTSKKRSAISRKVKAAKRTAWNVLGGVGIVAVVVWMFQFITGQ